MKFTLTYSEQNKGWTNFLPFHPDWMLRVNNRFFTIKNGQLYLHNDETNPLRNFFYGVFYPSKVKTVFNESVSDDKLFHNIVQETNIPWKTTLKTNLSNGTIEKNEFNNRESRWFAHTRNNESTSSYSGQMVQGIGNVVSATGLTVTFGAVSSLVNVGDQLIQLNGSAEEVIGVITSIDNNVITVSSIVTNPSVGFYAFCKKNSRAEGAEIRGYYMEVELENDTTDFVSLYAVSTNAVISGIHTNIDAKR